MHQIVKSEKASQHFLLMRPREQKLLYVASGDAKWHNRYGWEFGHIYQNYNVFIP